VDFLSSKAREGESEIWKSLKKEMDENLQEKKHQRLREGVMTL